MDQPSVVSVLPPVPPRNYLKLIGSALTSPIWSFLAVVAAAGVVGYVVWLQPPRDGDVKPKPTPPEPEKALVVPGPAVDRKVSAGRLVTLKAQAKAPITWAIDPKYAELLDIAPVGDAELHLVAVRDGEYYISASVVDNGKVSPPTWIKIQAGKLPPPGPGPGPTPDPGPTPPTPTPPTPKPVDPPIAGEGLRVLIVYESADLQNTDQQIPKMPPSQAGILFSRPLREFLDASCASGPDGRTKEWRIYDKDTDMKNDTATWRDAMARTRQSLPWIVISNGKTGYEGPLPMTVAETLTLIKKYGGN